MISYIFPRSLLFSFVYFILLLAALGLHCSAWAFSSCNGQALHWLLLLQRTGSKEHGLSHYGTWSWSPTACGIFPGQGLNLCLLH